MKLGEKIFRLRTEQGFSQETFGEKLGVSRQSVSKWETDQSVPELDKIVAISELFEVTTDYLLKETEETYGTAKEEPPRTEEYPQGAYRIGRRPHYEYKSKKMIGNLPLVHINLGLGIHRAKGVIAIGAIAQGWLAIGYVAMGGLCFGLVSLGRSCLRAGLFWQFFLWCDQLWRLCLRHLLHGRDEYWSVCFRRVSTRRTGGGRRRRQRKSCAGLFPCSRHLHADQQQTALQL